MHATSTYFMRVRKTRQTASTHYRYVEDSCFAPDLRDGHFRLISRTDELAAVFRKRHHILRVNEHDESRGRAHFRDVLVLLHIGNQGQTCADTGAKGLRDMMVGHVSAINFAFIGHPAAGPTIHKSRHLRGALRFSAPSVWNSLPQTVLISDSLSVFKSRLITVLFNQALTEH